MIAIAVTTAFTGIIPTYTAAQQLDLMAQNVAAQNITQQSFLNGLQRQSTNREGLSIALSKKQGLIPSGLQAVEYMHEVNALAVESNVTLEQLTIGQPHSILFAAGNNGAPNANQGASALSRGSLFISDISISISGTITQIANFTELLRTSKRYTQVSSVVMPDNGQSGGNTILVDLKAQIFMLKAK